MLQAVKIVLTSKKEVIMRPMRISDSELAAQAVGKKAGDNQILMQILLQKEIVKNLLLEIDGKKVTAAEREDLNELFTPAEYGQLLKVINKMSGGDDLGNEPVIEVVSFGAKLPGSADTQA